MRAGKNNSLQPTYTNLIQAFNQGIKVVENEICKDYKLAPERLFTIYSPSHTESVSLDLEKVNPRSLSGYLKAEKKEHAGKGERLLMIPIWQETHWAVLVLQINHKNKLVVAKYADTYVSKERGKNDLLSQQLQSIYPKAVIKEHSIYCLNAPGDPAKANTLTVENAKVLINYIYRGKTSLLEPTLASDKAISKFGEQQDREARDFFGTLPNELLAKIDSYFDTELLPPLSKGLYYHSPFGASFKKVKCKVKYLEWNPYVNPTLPGIETQELHHSEYKAAFRNLQKSLLPVETKIIKARMDGSTVVIDRYLDQAIQKSHDKRHNWEWKHKTIRDRLLIIATDAGSTELLGILSCSVEDISRLDLVAYTCQLEHKEDLLDYFWSLVKKDSAESPAWSVILRQRQTDSSKVSSICGLISPQDLAGYYSGTYKSGTFNLRNIGYREIQTLLHAKRLDCLRFLFANGLSEETMAMANSNDNEKSPSPLDVAQYNGDLHSLKLLLQGDLSPEISADADPTFKHLDCLKLLLQYGADPRVVNDFDQDPQLFHFLKVAPTNADPAPLKLCLQYGLDVNLCISGTDGGAKDFSLLTAAIEFGQSACVEVLLQYGANPYLHVIDESSKPTELGTYIYYLREKNLPTCTALVLLARNLYAQSEKGACYKNNSPSLEDAYNADPKTFKRVVKDMLSENSEWRWVTSKMGVKVLLFLAKKAEEEKFNSEFDSSGEFTFS